MERMSWYRMLETSQSARVIGVVASLRRMPFCRSSAFMLSAFPRHEVMIAIAMMPGTKNSMKRYSSERIDFATSVTKGGVPVIFWFITVTIALSAWILVFTEVELGSWT